jgi:hypothetical protein
MQSSMRSLAAPHHCRRGHWQDQHVGPSRGASDRARRRSTTNDAVDLFPSGGGRDDPPGRAHRHRCAPGSSGVAADALSWSGTFHAIGARLLREYAEQIGLDRAFTIMTAKILLT